MRGGREGGGGGLLEGRFHEALRIAAKGWGFGVVGKGEGVGKGMPAGRLRVGVEGATGRTRMDSSSPRRKDGGEGEAKGKGGNPLGGGLSIQGVRLMSHVQDESTSGVRKARSSEPQEASEKGELTKEGDREVLVERGVDEAKERRRDEVGGRGKADGRMTKGEASPLRLTEREVRIGVEGEG